MPKSPHFIRIQRDVLHLVDAIPYGRVTTFGIIGQELDVMARHVAYILTMLTEEEAVGVNWHRVVGDKGLLKPTKRRAISVHQSLLALEGIIVSDRGMVHDFEQICYHYE